MNTGGEVAGIMANMYAEVGKKSLEMGSQLISYLFLALVKKMAEKGEKLTTGQINMSKLLESGDELKQISLNSKSAMQFISKAEKAGLTFALLDDNVNKEGSTTIFFKAKDIEIVKAIMGQIEADKKNNIEEKVDKSIIEEFSLVSDKSVFIVDRENPENYIKAEFEKLDLQKGYLINPKNPDEFIYFEENIKDKAVSLEIHAVDGKVDKLDTSNSKYEDRASNIRKIVEKWGAVELVSSDEERLKFKDKVIEKRKSAEKAENDKKKTLDKIKEEVKETRDKQPSKDNKTKTKSKSKKGKAR